MPFITGQSSEIETPGPDATFKAWAKFFNAIEKGSGAKFLAWVSASGLPLAPVKPNSKQYATSDGLPVPASEWATAWLLEANVGPEIGKAIATGVTSTGRAITHQILPGFTKGVFKSGTVSGDLNRGLANTTTGIGNIADGLGGLGGISDFFSRLNEPSTWIRAGEVLIGALILGIGLWGIIGNTSAGKSIKKVIK